MPLYQLVWGICNQVLMIARQEVTDPVTFPTERLSNYDDITWGRFKVQVHYPLLEFA